MLIPRGLSSYLTYQTDTDRENQTYNTSLQFYIFPSCAFLYISLLTSSQTQLPSGVLFCFYGTRLIDLLRSEQDNLPLASDSEQQNDKFLSLSQISVLQNNTSTPKPNKWLPIQRKTMSEKENSTFPTILMRNEVRILFIPSFSYLSFPLTVYTVYYVNTDPLWGPGSLF